MTEYTVDDFNRHVFLLNIYLSTHILLMAYQLEGLRKDVFYDRYALKDENGHRVEDTPEEMWHRVAKSIAAVETTVEKKREWEEKFYSVLEGFQFVPGGRILTGAGSGVELTFYNCYVIPSPEDSRAGIFESVRTMVEIMSRGGGVGVNLSSLRPRGEYVRGVNGTASGAVSFGGLYSFATGLIIQGGSRRGALMLMLNDDHPDVEEFITVKRTMGQITNANLSVCVSDRFMEAVENDGDWDLKWNGKVYRTIKARHLWHLICESAHASGEPGMVFMERINKESNSWYFENLISVNPCVTGDTRVATTVGLRTIQQLYESQQQVAVQLDSRLSEQTSSTVTQVVQTGVKDIYRLRTEEGYTLRLTADHRVRTERGWIEAQQLQKGERLLLQNRGGAFGAVGDQEYGHLLGWYVGDGHYNVSKDAVVFSFFGQEKKELASVFAASVNRVVAAANGASTMNTSTTSVGVGVVDVADRDEARVTSGVSTSADSAAKLAVPAPVWEGTQAMQRGFLQALFTADGHVAGSTEKGVSVRLSSISTTLLEEVQQLLLNFGITSRVYENRREAQTRLMPNGKGGMAAYECNAQHDLVISKAALPVFAEQIGFITSAKQEKLQSLLSQYVRGPYQQEFIATFEALESQGQEMVYDLTEPVSHSFSANGLVVHNCGEQPLPAWGVCNLGAVNLAAFVDEATGQLDREGLGRAVRIAMRFLDNVVDGTPYFYKENEEAQMKIRRTGLGTMGLADALIKAKVRYGSDEGVAWAEEVYAIIRDEAYRASVDISREKGPFPVFDREKYLQGRFIQQLPKDIQEGIAKHGIRQGVLLTQAPTGTTSILSGVSSGIEPVYDFAFKRKDRLGEHLVYHPLYEKWKNANPDAKEAPAYFVTAKTLTPLEHVKMQAVAQKYTDASISKTVNAPNDHTIEAVEELYMKAYKLGCKGVTYYRDGSRDVSVLNSIDDKGKETVSGKKQEQGQPNMMAPTPRPRPEVVAGATYKIKTGYGTMFVTINHDEEGRPFEVFATIGKAGGFFAAKSEAICRLVSLALRSGIPAETVIDQIKGIRGPMPSWGKNGQILSIPDAIGQVLTSHVTSSQGQLNLQFAEQSQQLQSAAQQRLQQQTHTETVQVTQSVAPDGVEQTTVKASSIDSIADMGVAPQCPKCSNVLAMAEGCMNCYACGYSKCS